MAGEGFHGATVMERRKHGAQPGHPAAFEELVGQGVHPRFLDLPFGCRAVEPLEEFGKADHVHQLMGDNVEGEREKVNAGIPLDGSSNDVILEGISDFLAACCAGGKISGLEMKGHRDFNSLSSLSLIHISEPTRPY